jgi:DNA repair exonuclease SbcCD ATPase subunit
LQNDSVIKNTSQQLVDCTQQKNKAGQLLAGLERKQTLAQRDEYQTLKTQTAQLQTSLQTLQSQRESIEIPDPKTLEQKRSLLVEQSAQLQLLTTQKQKELENSQEQYTLGNFTHTQQWISLLQKIHTVLMQVTELIETYREKHQKIQNLKDELKRNKELNTIFSKELMVVALQDFLPSLETVINTFLDEVVDYQIRFLTPESIDDSLELDIEIHDHHGVRQVKSLSGGQRATLKIAWILAVSSLFNGQFLFLDETITSLDAEAVARIGRLLESYMAKRETKLLLVTHASQIQQMEMWDRVVKI